MSLITVDAEDVKTGEVRECLIENSVRFGETFKDDDGREMKRVPSRLSTPIVKDQPFMAWNLPFEKDAKEQGFTPAETYVDGVAAFPTAKGRREYVAKHNDDPIHGYNIDWDR